MVVPLAFVDSGQKRLSLYRFGDYLSISQSHLFSPKVQDLSFIYFFTQNLGSEINDIIRTINNIFKKCIGHIRFATLHAIFATSKPHKNIYQSLTPYIHAQIKYKIIKLFLSNNIMVVMVVVVVVWW